MESYLTFFSLDRKAAALECVLNTEEGVEERSLNGSGRRCHCFASISEMNGWMAEWTDRWMDWLLVLQDGGTGGGEKIKNTVKKAGSGGGEQIE
jgi:hypothetical protein